MARQIPITNPRIKDNQWINEAFNGVNNNRQYEDFVISDNYWIYLSILANAGGSGVDIKGYIDCSGNPNYPVASKGDAYAVSVAGKIGGASGFPVSVGDIIIAWVASVGGTQAAVGSNWNIKQVGLQRNFEVDLATGDLTQATVRDWTGAIGRNVALTAVGTFALSGTNFAVEAGGRVVAGVLAGSITVGRGSGFTPLIANNTVFGVGSFNSTATGGGNVAIGNGVLLAATTANQNIGIGSGVMGLTTTGLSNVGIGAAALAANVGGSQNTAVGTAALTLASSANANTAVGYAALDEATTGGSNTGIGVGALGSVNSGTFNTALGVNAGVFTTTGALNIFLGPSAGLNQTTGSNKLFIDNQDRGSAANDLTLSMIYGIFAATTALQFFTVNAHVLIREDLQFTTKTINVTSGDGAVINSPAGRFRKDNSGTTFTLTNSYITANSIIILTAANAAIDATAVNWTILAGAGSAVITFGVQPAADFDMNFLVIN